MALAEYQPTGPGGRPVYQLPPQWATYNNASNARYANFADEARKLGLTGDAVDQYALLHNQQWGQQNSTDAGGSWLEHHPWMAPVAVLGAGYGAAALGGSAAGGAAAGAGEGAAAGAGEGAAGAAGGTAATYVPGAEDIPLEAGGGGAGGSAGSGALEGGGMSDVYPGSGSQVVGDTVGSSSSGTPLSRILSGSGTTADWLSVAGNSGSSILGILGSRNAANAYGNLAGTYMGMGAPSRARYEASMSPGFDPTTIPGYSGALDTATKGVLARLAATGGNPYGNPGGLIEANRQIISGTALPAIEAYQRLNAGTGGYAGFNAAAPGAATAQIGAQGGVYNAVGSGLAGLLNPQPSLLDTLRGLNVQGLS